MKKVLLIAIFLLTTISTFAQAPTTGLVAYYPFNGNANDASGNSNHGTQQGGVNFTTATDRFGVAGKAAGFDGSQFISVPNNSSFNSTSITVSIWINLNSINNYNQRIIFKQNSGLQCIDQYSLKIYDNSLQFSLQQNNFCRMGYVNSPTLNFSKWSHIVGTYDGTTIRIYKDGNFMSSYFHNLPIDYGGRNLNIGGIVAVNHSYNFNGSLDDIRFYNRALTDTEVQTLYQAEAPPIPIDITTGLVAHYKMDGNAQDASGNSNHGTAQNGVTFGTDRFGNAGKVASFDGVDDRIDLNHTFGPFQELTVSAWVKTSVANTNLQAIVSSIGSECLHFQMSENASTNIVTFSSIPGPGGFGVALPILPCLPTNQWRFLTVKFASGNSKVYENGVQVSSSTQTYPNIIATNLLRIGSGFAGRYLTGSIDDVRMYNRALTDTEVQALYQAEVPPIDITTGLVAHYKMDGNAQDASGNGNHGTAQNGVAFGTDRFGNAGKAASFDGVDDRISVNNNASLNFSSSFTSTFWTKMNTWAETGNNARGIISKKPNDGSTGYVFYKDGYSQSKINFRMKGASAIDYNFSNSDVIINQWEFWSMVYNSTSGKVDIYKNGVLDKTLNTGNIGNMTNNSPFYIGFSETWNGYFNGSIDDVRMYNRALSDTEVLALYNSENSGVSLTTAMRLGGGLSTLNVGTGYNFTASLKNNGIASWVGDVYLKVKGDIPTLISSNNVISAGGTYNISSTFSPQTSQIGQNTSVELLTKQGTNDFIRASVVNGTVNPIVVNIEAASSVPVVRVPFIRLNQSEVNLGGTVQIIGGNFEPNTQVTIGSSPDISGAIYQAVTVASDGSINATFTVPNTFTERYLTIIGRNVKYDNPGALVLVNQSQEVATLSITKPYKAYETINITPEGNVAIEFSDKLLKGSAYPQSGASRSYRYEIGYQYAGGTGYTPLKQLPVETDLLNKEIRKTVLVPMTGFSTISQSGGWVLKFIIKDLYNNQRVAESPLVNINVVQNISKISMKWDRSFSPMPNQDPIGIAADGVARMYLVLEKNSPTGSPIQAVSVTLANYESNNDPTNFNNGAWLGRVKYANQQNNTQYSEEANGITTITAQNLSTNTDGKYWFWYVAPDDFTRDGAGYTVDSERDVYAKFTVVYADGTVELVTKDLQIVRPPLMLVHGLSSNSSAWDNFKLTNGQTPDHKLFKGNIFKVNIQPNGLFDVNAQGILNGTSIGKENSIGGVLEKTRNNGFVASQVDYVCHSMGGSVLRRALDNFSAIYYGNNSFYKTYQIGSINRVITINTPHGGSPWGDLITRIVPLLPYTFAKPLSFSYLWALSYEKEYTAYRYISSFIQPDQNNSSSKNCDIFFNPLCYYTFESSPAVKNLQIISGNGGIDFKEFGLPTHVITSDFIPGQTPIPNLENTIVDIEALNSQIQFLFKIFSFMNESSGSILPPPLDDVLDEFKNIYPKIGVAGKYLSAPEKALWVLKLTEAFMLVATRYNNWWDGDLIVPLTSQQAKLNPSSPQVSYFSSSNLVDAMLNYNHIKVTDQYPVSNKVKELLNKPVDSIYFGSLPSNIRPSNNLSKNLSGRDKTNLNGSNIVKKSYKELFDRNKITISKPISNQQISAGSQFNVEVNLQDSTNLKSVLVYFQSQDIGDTLQTRTHRFSISAENSLSRKELLLAKASYIKGDSTICYFDTLVINVQNAEVLIKFIAKPKVKSITHDEIFKPDYFLQYSSFGATIPDFTKLNISISNTSCLSYNTQTGQFKGLQKGEAVVVLTYDGIFKDTMYVAVGGGGVPYTQQISTSNVPVTGDGTICTGATISVPFSTTGGVFDVGNQYIVQLSDASGENFVSLETSGITSPLSARIPNGLSNADTYKIRVVSTSPPVIGTVAVQPIKIRNQDIVPIVSVKTGNWNDANTWSCGRIPIITNNITIAGGHTVTIPNGQTGFANNLIQIGTLLNAGNLRLKAEL